jgi:hypothetical protein
MAKIESNIKNSFMRVREHIRLLEQEIRANREFIIKQNNQIKFILEQLSKLMDKKPENKQEFESSTGNEGVYSHIHSFTIHSFNDYSTDMLYSDIIHSFNKMDNLEVEEEKIEETPEYYDELDNSVEDLSYEENKQDEPEIKRLSILERKKRENNTKFVNFKGLKKEIKEMFESFSKQELLTFLTIYQLEDEMNNVSYSDVANKLKLSEGCIRTYISSLIRKGAPIKKYRYNNKLVLLSISKEFRDLNLKKQLLAVYYRSDPYQPTLNELL